MLWICRLSGPVPLSTSGPVARSGLQLQGQSFWGEVSQVSQTHEAQSPQVDGSETPDPETCVWPSRVQCRQVSERASVVGGWSKGWVYVGAQAGPAHFSFFSVRDQRTCMRGCPLGPVNSPAASITSFGISSAPGAQLGLQHIRLGLGCSVPPSTSLFPPQPRQPRVASVLDFEFGELLPSIIKSES